jgi:uncharacterized protein YecT (DUF1311 family)
MKWLLVLLLSATPAFAQDKLDCNSPKNTAEENQCADQAFQKADKKLNQVWPRIKALAQQHDILDDTSDAHDYLAIFMAAQRAWLAYRDAHCREAGLPMHGGSGEGPLIGGCRAEVTADRVKYLKGFLPE